MPPSIDQTEAYPAVIIGGGQAGIALSYCLTQRGIDHHVLERNRPFSDWYNRRWDSFEMNTPNWMNVLPGEQQPFAPEASRDAYGSLSDARNTSRHTSGPCVRRSASKKSPISASAGTGVGK